MARSTSRTTVVAALVAASASVLFLTGCSPKPIAPPLVFPSDIGTSSWPAPRTPTPYTPSPWYQSNVPTASPELYQQARDLYALYFSYDAALQRMGGADPLPPQMADLLTGAALAKITALYQSYKQEGYYWDPEPTMIAPLKQAQLFDQVPWGTVIAMQTCEQTIGGQFFRGDGTLIYDGYPRMVVYHYFMTYDDHHQLVIDDITGGYDEVETCPF